MTIVHLTEDDMEAVVTQVQNGRKLEEVAADLDISLQMAASALRHWHQIPRSRSQTWLASLI